MEDQETEPLLIHTKPMDAFFPGRISILILSLISPYSYTVVAASLITRHCNQNREVNYCHLADLIPEWVSVNILWLSYWNASLAQPDPRTRRGSGCARLLECMGFTGSEHLADLMHVGYFRTCVNVARLKI